MRRIVIGIVIAIAILIAGCSDYVARATQISQSHSQITASEYEDAEAHFGGGPVEVVDVWDDARCQKLLERRNMARAFSLGFTGVTGAGGLTTIIPKDVDEEEKKKWDLGVGISMLGSAAVATVLGSLATAWSNEYEQNCNTEKPVIYEHPARDEEPQDLTDGGIE